MTQNHDAGQRWDAALYDSDHSYVWRFGEDVLELLEPRPGERILDLGAGTGHLAAKIAEAGATVVGLDASGDMVRQARELYPNVHFVQGDAASFCFDEPFDAVFSNATLHWVTRHEDAAASIARALKPGGRFVAEFGGRGNVKTVSTAIADARRRLGVDPLAALAWPWYFPSPGEYASLLERYGFEVRLLQHFDRPTAQTEGADGLRSWLRMYASPLMTGVPQEQMNELAEIVEELCRPRLWQDGRWVVDYRRLRVQAIKVGL